MRIARLTRAVNWKYALGEVLLIVIGITIALAVNSWWQDLQDRRVERTILRQIQAALQDDQKDLVAGLEWAKGNEEKLEGLLRQLRAGEHPGPEAGSALEAVSQWIIVSTKWRTGPYEELKNEGFSLISNDRIRTQIIEIYEIQLPRISGTNDIDQQFSLNQVGPYLRQHFYRNDADQWVPVDGYESLDADTYFVNLVEAKQRRLQNFIIPAFEGGIDAVNALISDMESETE